MSTDSTVITRDRSALWITINRPDDMAALIPDVSAGSNTAAMKLKMVFCELLINNPIAAEGFNSIREGRQPNWL